MTWSTTIYSLRSWYGRTIYHQAIWLEKILCLFNCFASRAVYIEVTNALNTDSFIQVLGRFMARRSPVRSIKSDNGTSFVKAANELKKALNEMNHEQVKRYFQKNGSDWITWENNLPAASHMGGAWDSLIRTARKILDVLVKTHSCSLIGENFRTILAETVGIINSRLLTMETLSNVSSQIPLARSNRVTQKTNVVLLPPG